MKSWYVEHRWEPDYGAEIIFAETAGKAKSIALYTDTFEDICEYTELRARRSPNFDKYYKDGKRRMDFSNDEERIILCQHGFYCYQDTVDYEMDCSICSAKDFCSLYKDYLEERDKEWN